MYRIGIGKAYANLSSGTPLTLGGVHIPSEYGLIGNRDGDIISLALTDAILGSANFGGIDEMFPENTPEFRNLKSFELLTAAFVRIANEGYRIGNIDIIVNTNIDFSALLSEIQSKLGIILEINRINIKIQQTETPAQTATAIALVDQNLLTKRNREVLARNNPTGF